MLFVAGALDCIFVEFPALKLKAGGCAGLVDIFAPKIFEGLAVLFDGNSC